MVGRPKANISYWLQEHKIPERCIRRCEILECISDPDHDHLGNSLNLKVSTSRGQIVHKI